MERRRLSGRVALRAVRDEDREFLLEVYAAGREAELALVQWDESVKRAFIEHQFKAQDTHYRANYAYSTHDVILLDDKPVGRLYLDRGNKQISILDIGILPAYRAQGVATEIVLRLQEEGEQSDRSVGIYIESFNAADKLFRELGFKMVHNDGGLQRFEWEPRL